MNFTLKETTIRDIQAAYLDGRLTCVQLVQAYLDRIAPTTRTVPPSMHSSSSILPRLRRPPRSTGCVRRPRRWWARCTAYRWR